MARTLSYVLCSGVGALAAVYTWHPVGVPLGYWSGQSMQCTASFICPVGSSIQRVVLSGGLTNFTTQATQTGGKQASQSTVFSDLFLYQVRNNAVWSYYLQRHFEWTRQGSWGSGSPTDTNEAAAFSWSTPWDALEWDADIRLKGTGSNGFGLQLNSQTFGQTTSGIVGPINQPSGTIWFRVLTSTTS